jgi:hypothetical protein
VSYCCLASSEQFFSSNITFDEMMISALYYTNRVNLIFIVVYQGNKFVGRHVTSIGHIILIPSLKVSPVTPSW